MLRLKATQVIIRFRVLTSKSMWAISTTLLFVLIVDSSPIINATVPSYNLRCYPARPSVPLPSRAECRLTVQMLSNLWHCAGRNIRWHPQNPSQSPKTGGLPYTPAEVSPCRARLSLTRPEEDIFQPDIVAGAADLILRRCFEAYGVEGRVPKHAVQLELFGPEKSDIEGLGMETNDTLVPSNGNRGKSFFASSVLID